MSDNTNKTHQGDVPTTGHSWDGIEEYDNPMPRWWLTVFYICIAWGVVYSILMPSWPGLTGAFPGLLGYSTRGEVEQEIVAFNDANAAINAELAAADLTAIADDPELNQYAMNAGAAVFRTFCAQCHGSGAAGAVGFPNLLDDDWLWGGSIEDIHFTVAHGIRNEVDDDARWSQMPAFGELLEGTEINALANFVMSLSGDPMDASVVAEGATLFADNCASCHADAGTGDREQGAPNLTDAIWLYGGDYDALVHTITYARFGIMPPMGGADLSDAEINAVATYVHALGGGE